MLEVEITGVVKRGWPHIGWKQQTEMDMLKARLQHEDVSGGME